MQLRILGCSGGIGGPQFRTTSMLIDRDVLIDAGTGVGDLSLDELTQIDCLFLTHSHLDHVACLPFIVDTVGDRRSKPLVVYALEETIAAVHRHIFNWAIWPDFTQLPSPQQPYLTFKSLRLGQTVQIGDRRFTSLPANHTVPAVGYQLNTVNGSLVFSGDTDVCPEFWQMVNAISDLRYLIIETAFPVKEERLARSSRHLSPDTLAESLNHLQRQVDVYITHMKPGQLEAIMKEVLHRTGSFPIKMLHDNLVIHL